MFDWLQSFADWLIYGVFGVEPASKLGDALNFFVYDTLKILILLFLIINIMGVVNSYFPVERIRNFLSRRKLYGLEYFIASVFGASTPFCSCSSVPLFIGFVRGGIPLGVTLSFLITSPLVNEIAVAIFLGMFGLKTTIIYALSGVLLGMFGGMFLSAFKLEKYLTPWARAFLQEAQPEEHAETENRTLVQRLPGIFKESRDIMKSVFWYIIIGISIGALMHGFIPTGFFEEYITKENPLGVPLAVLFGVPMYSNAAGVLPIIQVFVQKGIPLGTAIAFMMAVIGLSIPEATLLKKVMTWKLVVIFFSTITLFIMISGYVFNLIL
jgi:uncharacterized protein